MNSCDILFKSNINRMTYLYKINNKTLKIASNNISQVFRTCSLQEPILNLIIRCVGIVC